jgi:trehalose/maltose hydrolase-like predicted phosphorylase
VHESGTYLNGFYETWPIVYGEAAYGFAKSGQTMLEVPDGTLLKLDLARQREREVGEKGALYPWRTINGEEASAYYAASTAQYHINADIVFAANRYVALTGDVEFLVDGFVDLAELKEWQRAADEMYIPYDEKAGVHLQDDDFLAREVWDFANTPPDHYPLLPHYHPLVIYRLQVIKQADVVLATFLLGEHFTAAEKRRIFDYYDPLTTGDSSLSVCIQSVMAVELGYYAQAYRYFADAVVMDLGDIGGNVRDGLHIASLGGTWMALVHGFAGLCDHGGRLRFHPWLPEG